MRHFFCRSTILFDRSRETCQGKIGPDEPPSVRVAVDELITDVQRKSGIRIPYSTYSSPLAGDVFVSTQPWAAKGAWFVRIKNSIVAIHGSDVAATERAVRAFHEQYVKPAKGPVIGGWTSIELKEGPQPEDVFDAEVDRVKELRRHNRLCGSKSR